VLKRGLFLNATTGDVDPELQRKFRGFIGANPFTGSGPLYDEFAALWASLDPDVYPQTGPNNPINFYTPYAYDAGTLHSFKEIFWNAS
jgi:hypothetical protein